jgi:hypothetical protein
MIALPRLRWSIRWLLLATALAGAACAVPAYFVAQIRGEAAAAKIIRAAIAEDHLAAGNRHGPGHVSEGPRCYGWIDDYLCRLAGSRNEVGSVDIVGDRSARAFVEHAHVLPHITDLTIDIRAPDDRRYGTVTQTHIDAAARCRCRCLRSLRIVGDMAPDVQFAGLRQFESIELMKVHPAAGLPYQVIDQLGTLPVDHLYILCENDESKDIYFPPEAFTSFASSTCTSIEIWCGMDDRAFELISAAPRLRILKVECLTLGIGGLRITDEGIRRASKHLVAEELDIGGAEFTDACVDYLAEMKNLRRVGLPGLTMHGKRRLKELRPDIESN